MLLLRVCCTISSGSIANVFLHYEMGISAGTFSYPFDVDMMFTKYHLALVS